jgi:hypothetical protein
MPPHLLELEPAHHEPVLDLLLGQVLPVRGILVDPDEIVVPPGRARRRPLGGRKESLYLVMKSISIM